VNTHVTSSEQGVRADSYADMFDKDEEGKKRKGITPLWLTPTTIL